jgi:hypothetical protein
VRERARERYVFPHHKVVVTKRLIEMCESQEGREDME